MYKFIYGLVFSIGQYEFLSYILKNIFELFFSQFSWKPIKSFIESVTLGSTSSLNKPLKKIK